jgi:hypothetical protein
MVLAADADRQLVLNADATVLVVTAILAVTAVGFDG